jgi:D-psicose/D-tagatose/L-ribulose 3-epimerase
MTEQNVDRWRREVTEQFLEAKAANPKKFERRLDLSWSNWGFGIEDLDDSCARLANAGMKFIELHGNHYGDDLGYGVEETLETTCRYGLGVSGVCGMFSDDNDLSSNRPIQQQEAIEYIRREVDFTAAVGGQYLLVVPGSVGRPDAYDNTEFHRSVRALQSVAEIFTAKGVKAAIEPIRAAEVSIVRSVADAIAYIEAVDHPGVQHINGDVYHMQSEEVNIPQAILKAGDRLVNLHLADSNRGALGDGSMDIDTMIMALYLIGHNRDGRYVTPEPLGPGAGPYPARNGKPDAAKLDTLVNHSISYFRAREEAVLAL